MNRELASFVAAVQFLTRVPTPQLEPFDAAGLARSARYFPLVGALVGAVAVCVWWLASRHLPAAVAVGLSMAASVLLTGAFHEDGFADACDGFGGGRTAPQVLAIMKDSRIGAYGAIGIVLMMGLKWSALDALATDSAMFVPLVIGSHLASRWCACALMWRLPYVRTDETSKSRAAVAGFTGGEWLIGGMIALLAFAPAVPWAVRARGVIAAWALAAGAAAAGTAAWIAARHVRRRIGGYTGDCLGAVQQMSELAFLLGGLVMIGPGPP